MIEKSWDSLIHITANMPPWLSAFLVGWLLSVGAAQTLKFWMPLRWDEDDREVTIRLVAFAFAAGAAGLVYVQLPDATPGVLTLVMIGTGLWSPIAFAMLQAGLRRWERFAWIADVLSGDKRGVIAAKIKGEDP